MRHLLILAGIVLLISSCKKETLQKSNLPEYQTLVTDTKGTELKEAYSGLRMRLVAEEFRPYNANGTLLQRGWIEFNAVRVRILQAAQNYVIVDMPSLQTYNAVTIAMRVGIDQSALASLARLALYYRPTIAGVIYKGFTGGVADRSFKMPAEMIHDAAGNLYVIDQHYTAYDTIKKISPTGVLSTVAPTGTRRLVGIGIDAARNRLYVADATTQQVKYTSLSSPGSYTVLAGSGTVGNVDGTGTAASFNFGTMMVNDFYTNEQGQGLTVDDAGNVYVGETYPGSVSSQLRRITPSGVVTTIPGSRTVPVGSAMETTTPSGLSVIGSTVYSVGGFSGTLQGIVRFNNDGTLTRFVGGLSYEHFADGTGTAVKFAFPKAISRVPGYFFVADGVNGALRRVNESDGTTITLAGVGRMMTNSGSGSGAFIPPLQDSFRMRSVYSSITADPSYYIRSAGVIRMDQVGGVTAINPGLIYVSDYGYKCIWKITIR